MHLVFGVSIEGVGNYNEDELKQMKEKLKINLRIPYREIKDNLSKKIFPP